MPLTSIIVCSLVVAAFSAFGIVLFGVTLYERSAAPTLHAGE